MEENPTGRLIGPKDVAALFGVSTKTVLNWAKAGRIPAVWTPGGRVKFPADELNQVVAEHWSGAQADRAVDSGRHA